MSDPVNRPAHYTRGKIETIDFIEDQGLNFSRGQIIKYTVRAGYKDPSKEVEDLEKARWYVEREIARLKSQARVRRFNEAHLDEPVQERATFVVDAGAVHEVLK